MSIVFPVTSLIALPAQAWAQSAPSPAFAAPKPLPAPVVHDDPAWHTIDYHAQEHAAAAIALPANSARPPVRAERLTLLDEVGRLASPVAPDKVAGWKRLLHQPKKLAATDAAKLHVLVGEVTLAQDENPEQALWHFAQARKLSRAQDEAHGLAVYDSAIAHFYQGAYGAARAAFKYALTAKPGLHGFDHRTCTLFLRHASACLGYHEERAKIGIPEPPRLDPLCGASSLAQALKTYGKPYDKPTLLRNMRVTGRGSNMQDVLNGAQKLGLAAHVAHVKDAGLILLPKPLVAYVEHDHFVSVTNADKNGVTYLCADCGPWPGGRVSLTWAQWHRMEATAYAVLSKPGSDIDGALLELCAGRTRHRRTDRLDAACAVLRPDAPRNALWRTLANHARVVCGVSPGLYPTTSRYSSAVASCSTAKCYKCQPCPTHKACPLPGETHGPALLCSLSRSLIATMRIAEGMLSNSPQKSRS